MCLWRSADNSTTIKYLSIQAVLRHFQQSYTQLNRSAPIR
jgi:hypothetical protein